MTGSANVRRGRDHHGFKGGYVHKHGTPTVEEAKAKYPHGTVKRYVMARCRCLPRAVAASEYNLALRESHRAGWQVERTVPRWTGPKERSRAADGQYHCQFCDVEVNPYRLKRHEKACSPGAHPDVPNAYVVVNRKTGERRPTQHATRAEARVECQRLNKRDRPKPPTELVSAKKVREHLQRCQRHGLGVQSIGRACGVAPSVLDRLMRGMIKRTRRSTEAKILSVELSEYRLIGRDIPAGPTLKMIDLLVAVGYRKGWIAQQTGSKCRALQIGRAVKEGRAVVRADKARAVKALYAKCWAGNPKLRVLDPTGQFSGERLAPERGADAVPAIVPLSKRDPKIAARWKNLDLSGVAS